MTTLKQLRETYVPSANMRNVANSLEGSGHRVTSHYGTVMLKSDNEDHAHDILSGHKGFEPHKSGDYIHSDTGTRVRITDHEDGHAVLKEIK